MLDGVAPASETTLGVVVAGLRLDALLRAGRRLEVVAVGDAVATAASRLGWARAEAAALRDAATVAQATGDARTALRLLRRLQLLDERLGSSGAATLTAVGVAQAALGDVPAARASLERARSRPRRRRARRGPTRPPSAASPTSTSGSGTTHARSACTATP